MEPIFDISIYRHVSGDLLFLPIAINELGFGSCGNYPIILNTPHSFIDIGVIIKKEIEYLKENPIIQRKDGVIEWIVSPHTKTKNDFFQNWINVGVSYNPNTVEVYGIKSGYKISTSKFDGSGFLGTNYMPTFQLPLDATDEQLGETVLRAFDAIPGIVLKHYDDYTKK